MSNIRTVVIYILQLTIVVLDALGQRGYGPQDRLQGWCEFPWQVLGDLVL